VSKEEDFWPRLFSESDSDLEAILALSESDGSVKRDAIIHLLRIHVESQAWMKAMPLDPAEDSWIQLQRRLGLIGGLVTKGEILGVWRKEGEELVFSPEVNRLLAQLKPKWSESPGAFEQQLKRRHNNLLFPKERRTITQADIDAAAERDRADYEVVKGRLQVIAADLSKLPERITAPTLNPFRQRTEDLIQDAAGVGGNAADIAARSKELRRTLVSSWEMVLSEGSEERKELNAIEKFYHEKVAMFEVPFFAQMLRKDGPIPDDDIVPALLSEDCDTIALVFNWLDQSTQAKFQKAAAEIIEMARRESGEIEGLDAKMRVLTVQSVPEPA
jgi:hypothetical protein